MRKPGDPDYDEYESLPPTATLATFMSAGALAGIMEHCVMYPLDSAKTRMQSLIPAHSFPQRSVFGTLEHMVQKEGVFRPVRGLSAVVTGAGPAHALYFGSYEKIKSILLPMTGGNYNNVVYGAAGSVATVFHDAVMTPADVVKQRMQMYNSPYRSCIDCVRQTWKLEGGQAFYRSYTTQLGMNIPFQSLHFMVYEFLQKKMNKEGKYNPKVHVASGAIAGAVASAVTTPLDVCKTLLNTQEGRALRQVGTSKIKGLKYAMKTVYRVGGFRAFFKGMSARVLYQMPSTAIAWSVYEFFKYCMTQRDPEQRRGGGGVDLDLDRKVKSVVEEKVGELVGVKTT